MCIEETETGQNKRELMGCASQMGNENKLYLSLNDKEAHTHVSTRAYPLLLVVATAHEQSSLHVTAITCRGEEAHKHTSKYKCVTRTLVLACLMAHDTFEHPSQHNLHSKKHNTLTKSMRVPSVESLMLHAPSSQPDPTTKHSCSFTQHISTHSPTSMRVPRVESLMLHAPSSQPDPTIVFFRCVPLREEGGRQVGLCVGQVKGYECECFMCE